MRIMTEIHWDVEQGSPEWAALHEGRLTASDASKLLTPTGKPSSSRNEILGRVVAEAMGLQHTETTPFTTDWMQRGLELEPEARNWLSFEKDLEIKQVGFISAPFIGASPDGVVEEGVDLIPCEFKCPKASTHIKWMLNGVLPPEHKAQVHMQMALLEAPYAHFMSYHPGMEPFYLRVEGDDFTSAMYDALSSFQQEALALMRKLK